MSAENTGVSYTIKGGTGFDAPWIVLHGADVAHANMMLAELADSVGMALLAETAKKFQALNGGKTWTKTAPVPADSSTPSAIQSASQPAADAAPQQPPQQPQADPGTHEAASPGEAQVPRDVQFCPMHNEQRRYFGPGVSSRTGNAFGASYRCPQRGCAAKPPPPWSLWQREDGKWEIKPWTGGR